METIGDRIREAMLSAGLNQTELAKRIGVSKQAINAMLSSNTKNPNPTNCFAIADATAFEARWIVTGRGPKTKQEAARDRLDISDLPPDSQAAIRAVLHSLAQQQESGSQDGPRKNHNGQ